MLLGANVSATEKQSQTVNKNEIADTTGGVGQVAAVYSVTGSITSQAYLIVEERDAIRFGMLLTDAPEKIFGATSADHHFNSDCQDSYNEICSIVGGVLSSVCEALFEEELIFEKNELVQTGSQETQSYENGFILDQDYGVSSFELSVDDTKIGVMHLLLPSQLLSVLENARPAEDVSANAAISDVTFHPPEENASFAKEENSRQVDQSAWDGNVLIINDFEKDASTIRQALDAEDIAYDQISPAEEMTKSMLADYRAIFLVVEKLDELALGIAIKINSFCSIPLIVAASQWTQLEVIKAVRYGVNDILMTPAESAEVVQKVRGLERMNA